MSYQISNGLHFILDSKSFVCINYLSNIFLGCPFKFLIKVMCLNMFSYCFMVTNHFINFLITAEFTSIKIPLANYQKYFIYFHYFFIEALILKFQVIEHCYQNFQWYSDNYYLNLYSLSLKKSCIFLTESVSQSDEAINFIIKSATITHDSIISILILIYITSANFIFLQRWVFYFN